MLMEWDHVRGQRWRLHGSDPPVEVDATDLHGGPDADPRGMRLGTTYVYHRTGDGPWQRSEWTSLLLTMRGLSETTPEPTP
jgi:hypothetical protein